MQPELFQAILGKRDDSGNRTYDGEPELFIRLDNGEIKRLAVLYSIPSVPEEYLRAVGDAKSPLLDRIIDAIAENDVEVESKAMAYAQSQQSVDAGLALEREEWAKVLKPILAEVNKPLDADALAAKIAEALFVQGDKKPDSIHLFCGDDEVGGWTESSITKDISRVIRGEVKHG